VSAGFVGAEAVIERDAEAIEAEMASAAWVGAVEEGTMDDTVRHGVVLAAWSPAADSMRPDGDR